MRTSSLVFLLLACTLFSAECKKKLTKKQKKVLKKFNKVKDDYKRIQSEVDEISEELTIVENELNGTVTSRHTYNVDALTVVDADSTATACGPYPLTSWSETLDIVIAAGATADSADSFSSGTWTAPIAGWYHICSFSRFRNTGNANDVTVLVS